ncbi:MAG: serine/threonine protein kinase [Deltaproteobacteria bacterium]|nr:serine/threonine protein kinase [Deltaproteobacteria bacterium]
MAEVFLVQTRGVGGFEKLLAIKRLLPHCIEDQQTVDLLADEAKITVKLTHPNIVQVFDFGRVDDSYFIAMEYVDGVDLKSLVQIDDEHSHPMPQDVALHVVISALQGLDFAHKRKDEKGEALGIIHRDVSPHNLLISQDGQVKLTDFGVARARISSHVSVVGDIRGKFSYMPPEQALGGEIDQRVDIFAAGAILYELLCGQQPYRSTSSGEQIKLLTGKISPPSVLESDVLPSLDAITLKALAKDPAERYATAAEFASVLGAEFDRLNDTDHLTAQQKLAGMVQRRSAENKRAKKVNPSGRLMVSMNEHDRTFGDSLIFRPQQASGEVKVRAESNNTLRLAPSVAFGDALLAKAASATTPRALKDAPTRALSAQKSDQLAYAKTQLFAHPSAQEDEEEDTTLIQDNPLYREDEDSLHDALTQVEVPLPSHTHHLTAGNALTSGEIETRVHRAMGMEHLQIHEDEGADGRHAAKTLHDRLPMDEARFLATVEMEPELLRSANQKVQQKKAAPAVETKQGSLPIPNTPPAVKQAEHAQRKLNRQRELLGTYITIALAVALGLGAALLVALW